MSEAYEVGLSFALGDGVEESAVLAKRDISALDKATGVGALSMRDLRETADRLSKLSLDLDKRHDKRPEEPAKMLSSVSQRQDAEAKSFAPLVDIAGRTKALVGGPGQTVSDVVLLPTSPVATDVSGTFKANSPGSKSASKGDLFSGSSRTLYRVDQSSTSSSDTRTQGRTPDAPTQTVSGATSKPNVTILRMSNLSHAADLNRPEVSQPGAPVKTTASIGLQSLPQARAPSLGSPAVTSMSPSSTQSSPIHAPISTSGNNDKNSLADWHSPVRPLIANDAKWVTTQHDPAERSPANTTVDAPSAPPSNLREQQHIEGDVYLDGAMVGRWISRFLSREASRSSTGPTGFDKRRNPLMPGASLGM